MKNNGYFYAKIGGISIIICMFFCFIWSTTGYCMPSFSGILALASAAAFLFFTLKGSVLIALMEEQNKQH